MTTDELRKVLHKAPFTPFTIHLADGHFLHVPHPDFLALSGGGAVIVTSPREFDYTVVDLSLVTRLEVPGSKQPEERS